MKRKYILLFILSLLFVAQSCDRELPYPIDEVKRGVAIDIIRTEGSDGVLYRDKTDGDFGIVLSIPPQQGDYSFLKSVELLAVIERILPDPTEDEPNRTKTVRDTKIIRDNITSLPLTIDLDIAGIYSQFGLETPQLGETLYFTANVILEDNSVIPGWTEISGFNNRILTGWRVGNRAYSYNVRYPVVCELVLDDFVGTAKVTKDDWDGAGYDVEITKVSDTELSIAGLFNGVAANPLVIKINPIDYTLSFDKQNLLPNSGSIWWNPARPTYNNFSLGGGTGIVNACDGILSFSATATVDAGSFGSVSFVIEK